MEPKFPDEMTCRGPKGPSQSLSPLGCSELCGQRHNICRLVPSYVLTQPELRKDFLFLPPLQRCRSWRRSAAPIPREDSRMLPGSFVEAVLPLRACLIQLNCDRRCPGSALPAPLRSEEPWGSLLLPPSNPYRWRCHWAGPATSIRTADPCQLRVRSASGSGRLPRELPVRGAQGRGVDAIWLSLTRVPAGS